MVEGSDTQVSVTRPLPVDSSERRAPFLTRCGITKHVISLYLPGLKSGVSREVLMTKIYCGIGSRQTPPHILDQMESIAGDLANLNCILRSGGATGADSAFMNGCIQNNGKMEIFLPWVNYNDWYKTLDRSCYTAQSSETATQIAEYFHPAWNRCSYGAKKMHARNANIIGGRHFDIIADFVVCWTVDGKDTGGTGLALRIADYLNIPVFNLYFNQHLINLQKYIKNNF